MPNRIDGYLYNCNAAIGMHHVAIGFESAAGDSALHFMKLEPRFGDRDGRANIDAPRDLGLERLGRQMPPGVERDDALRFTPLRERSDAHGRMGVREVRAPDRIKR